MKNIIAIVRNSLIGSTAILMANTSSTLAKPPACQFDLAADRLEIIEYKPNINGRMNVRITGVIRNVGGVNFNGGTNRGSAGLYIGSWYEPTRPLSLISTTPLTSLTPGQEMKVVHETTWESASPSEGEFPPKYVLKIDYPFRRDLLSGAPIKISDCNKANNSVEKNIAEVKRIRKSPLTGGGPTQVLDK